jgi:hypothetical protein
MMDAVVPLKLADVERLRILLHSIETNFAELPRLWVVVPDEQLPSISRQLPRQDLLRLVPETTIVPEFRRYRVKGWYKQQLIKLAMADHVATDLYLLMDADVICARPVVAADLAIDGRGKCHRYSAATHERWYSWASRVLALPKSWWKHGVTPAVLHRQGVRLLAAYLEDRSPRPGLQIWLQTKLQSAFRAVSGRGRSCASWRSVLLESLPWTEYALYFSFLENAGEFERFHVAVGQSLSGHCLWQRDNFDHWHPACSQISAPFIVAQSISGVPPEQIYERVKPLFQAKDIQGSLGA